MEEKGNKEVGVGGGVTREKVAENMFDGPRPGNHTMGLDLQANNLLGTWC